MPYTIEIRIDTDMNGFSKAAKVGEMLGAVGQGTLSVLSGLGWGLGIMGVGGRPAQVASVALRERAWKASSDTMQNAIQGNLCYLGVRKKAPHAELELQVVHATSPTMQLVTYSAPNSSSGGDRCTTTFVRRITTFNCTSLALIPSAHKPQHRPIQPMVRFFPGLRRQL